MILTIVTILNVGFVGEQQQLHPIQEQLAKKYSQFQIKSTKYEDNDPTLLKKLEADFVNAGKESKENQEDKRILLISGQKGCDFVQRKEIQALIESKKVFVMWVGHQPPPQLVANQPWLNKVALPAYIIKSYPRLIEVFGDRLVSMEAVPNNLKESDLQSALQKWNKDYSEEAIMIKPNDTRVPMGIFLGGDAPTPDGIQLYWSEKEAFEAGKTLGKMALQENKFLWMTNGPRTGKFYPTSSNPKKPIIRQFRIEGTGADSKWVTVEALLKNTTEEALLKAQDESTHQQIIAHAMNAPLDPVSDAFIKGVESNGLKKNIDFRFVDFKFGKSAMHAILALLKQHPNAEVYYSAESISNAALGYLFKNTYAFRVGNMNVEHENALSSFLASGIVSEFVLDTLKKSLMNSTKKQALLTQGSPDVVRIVESTVLFMGNPKQATENAKNAKIQSDTPAPMIHSQTGVNAASAVVPGIQPQVSNFGSCPPKILLNN